MPEINWDDFLDPIKAQIDESLRNLTDAAGEDWNEVRDEIATDMARAIKSGKTRHIKWVRARSQITLQRAGIRIAKNKRAEWNKTVSVITGMGIRLAKALVLGPGGLIA